MSDTSHELHALNVKMRKALQTKMVPKNMTLILCSVHVSQNLSTVLV
jgi:hypothetical protein